MVLIGNITLGVLEQQHRLGQLCQKTEAETWDPALALRWGKTLAADGAAPRVPQAHVRHHCRASWRWSGNVSDVFEPST